MTLIIVEGKDDKDFISYLLDEVLHISNENYRILQNGTYGIKENDINIMNKIQMSIDKGEIIILINDQNSNFQKRRDELF